MYADATTVKTLARNVGSRLASELIAAVAEQCDKMIDGRLATVYDWPATATNPVQDPIKSAANLITAGRLEQSGYAQTEGEQDQKITYGRSLELQGLALLNQIVRGEVYVPGLDRTIPASYSNNTKVGYAGQTGGLRGKVRS